jgi:hypothetical protein
MIVISCFEENLQLFLLSLSIKAYLPRQAVFGFSALLQECVFSKRISPENRKGGFRDDQKDRLFCGKTGRLLFPVLFNSDFFFGFSQKAGIKRNPLFANTGGCSCEAFPDPGKRLFVITKSVFAAGFFSCSASVFLCSCPKNSLAPNTKDPSSGSYRLVFRRNRPGCFEVFFCLLLFSRC